MEESPATRLSLLVRLHDAADQEAWGQFVEVYAPLLHGFARKHGLQDADAADLTQDVLRAVLNAIGRLDYDPRKGSFRGWLFTIARNRLRNFLAARNRPGQATGDTSTQRLLEAQPAPDEQAAWDQEYHRRLFAWAAERVRVQFEPTTWQAFWRTAVEGQSGQEVSVALGISAGAIYVARSRVLARIKEEIRFIHEEE
jgi:RNA polymerase sigma-70 factor (ECF subfamily)